MGAHRKGVSERRKRPVVGRIVTAVSISETTLERMDLLCRLTGEARGRIVDAALMHPRACVCACCEAIAREVG